jgi:hypothetical protein
VPGLPRGVGNERIPEGGTFDSASQWFVCEPVTDERGATITRSYAFFDAGGAAQEAFDEELTTAIGLRLALEAHPERDGNTGTILIEQDLLVSGLAGTETSRVWSGTISEHREGVPPQRPPRQDGEEAVEGQGGPRSGGPGDPGQGGPPSGDGERPAPGERPDPSDLVMDETVTISDVVLDYPLSEGAFPLSGSIAREAHLEGGPEGAVDRSSLLTFNGTQYATLTVGGETSEVDLTQPPRPPRGPER